MRKKLINCFKNTLEQINTNEALVEKTKAAVKNTTVFSASSTATVCVNKQFDTSVTVVADTTFNAAKRLVLNGEKTAVLNFASAVNPGGGVTIGAMAQEECLCRSSNLYACLKQNRLMRDYYMPHRFENNCFYSDRLIYSKAVTVFKTDDAVPQLMPEKDWFEVDVITCAAPNMREAEDVDKEELNKIFNSRIREILNVAVFCGAKSLVLGAFGCGAFKNPPQLVAKAFKDVIEEFNGAFETIVFAIKPTNNKNFEVFSQVLCVPQKEWTQEEFEEWRKSNFYFGKKFSILGDSISALSATVPYGYKPFYKDDVCKTSGVKKAQDIWWGKVIAFFGGKLLVNNSYSGSKVTSKDKSFPAGISQKRIDELETLSQKPDVILVYLGFNDWVNGAEVKSTMTRNKPISEYFDYSYFNMIIAIKNKYPEAEIWCLTLNPTFISTDLTFAFSFEKKGIHIEKYNDIIRQAAGAKNRRLIDLFENDMRNDTIDGLHPNKEGMLTLAQSVCLSVSGDASLCKNEKFFENEFEVINPNIIYCDSNFHSFVQGEELTGAKELYCENCGLSLVIPNENFHEILLNDYAGSVFCGDVISEKWLKQKELDSSEQKVKPSEDETKDTEESKTEAEEKLFCSECGTQLKAGDKFCLKCGAKIFIDLNNATKNCKQCNGINNEKAKFCKHCGAEFENKKKDEIDKSSKPKESLQEVPEIIDDRYKIIRQVGKGTSSIVFLAQDMKLERVCAVKMIRKNTYANAIAAEESLNEANKLKFLAHIGIPQLYDIYDGEYRLCIVMEYIEGKNLRTIVNEAKEPLDEETLRGWAKQICSILYYLHTMKPARIFRDLKPANIILQTNGRIKLIDFGTMKTFDDSKAEDTVNLGTKGYAAPEQFGGKGATDARTDIYGFGMTMYHLITGVNPSLPPFELRPIGEYRKDISKGFEDIIMKCIRVEREERYQNAMEIIMDIERLDWAQNEEMH